MRFRSPKYSLGVLLLATVVTTGCSSIDSSEVTMPATAQPVSLTAEPSNIRPQFLTASTCPTRPAFGFNFVLRLGGNPHVAFRQARFRFDDRFGVITVPRVVTTNTFTNSGAVPFPSGSTLPSASPIPFPSSTPLTGVISIVGTSSELPVAVEFPCDVRPDGTLIIVVDFDDQGRSRSSKVRVRVG
jgi:hypothetical protein